MRKHLFVALLLVAGAIPLHASEEEMTIPRTEDGTLLTGRVAEVDRALENRMFDPASVPNPAPIVHDYDQVFLEVNLVPSLEDSTFSGVARFLVRSQISPLSSLGFHLHESATIDSILVEGTKRDFSRSDSPDLITISPWLATNGLVTVDLAELNLMQDDMVELEIYYRGRIAVYSGIGMTYQWGTSSRPSAEVLYTMAEPHDARLWIPSYDQPGDKFDSTRIVLTLPASYKVLANGQLEYENEEIVGEDTLKTTSWLNSNPISSYLIHFAAKDYYVHDAGTAGVNDTPVHYWVYKEWYYEDPLYPVDYSQENAIYDFGRTPQMIEAFEAAYGPYPFSKYDQAIVPMGGAMEHQTATSMGEGYAGSGNRVGEMVVAHELAHQWWGDHVGPHTFQDIWLNEGFATYSEAIWTEAVFPDYVAGYMLEMQNAAKSQDSRTSYPISDPPYPYTVGLVYDKGGAVLHMLRLEMGDEDFFNGMKSYGIAYGYGNAATADFQAVMETESGKDLSTFFDQWVHGKRWPQFGLRNYWIEENGEGGYDTWLVVEQKQSWSQLFETSMPVRLRSLEDRAEDTVYVAHIDAARLDTVFLGTHPWRPKQGVFNYKNWVMCDVDASGLTGVETPDVQALPQRFDVTQAWPNPFNAAASFELFLPSSSLVNVDIVNMLGRQVATLANERMSAGRHRFSWQPAPDLASGVYLIRVHAADRQIIRRVTLVR